METSDSLVESSFLLTGLQPGEEIVISGGTVSTVSAGGTYFVCH
jgi:preprotein translocase subunit YajC